MEDLRVSLGVIMPSEIRNALTGILGFAEFLLQPEMLPGPGEVAEIGKVIVESGVELQRLVENHLLYTELRLLDYHPDHSSPWLQPDEIETESFLAFFSKYLAKKAKRTADLRLQLTDASFYFSPKSLQKILLEILGNAFTYSSSGQIVRVKSLVEDEYFVLQITDHGKGMSDEQIADIGRFTQFTDDWYDTQQGSGMGLILAQLLVKLHDGRLVIKSAAELGTTVVVALPYIKPARGGRHEHHSTD
jgi:signal transduction histidine kinase